VRHDALGLPTSRTFQFSLTWLVIATLVIGAFFGGISVGRLCHEIEHRQERKAFDQERRDFHDAQVRSAGQAIGSE